MQASLSRGLLYTKIVCTGHRLQHRRDDEWPTSRQATRRAVGEKGGGVSVTADANWDHGRSKLQWMTGKMWESVVSEKNAWHHCCRRPTYQWRQVRQSSC